MDGAVAHRSARLKVKEPLEIEHLLDIFAGAESSRAAVQRTAVEVEESRL